MKKLLYILLVGLIILLIPSFFTVGNCVSNQDQEKMETIKGEVIVLDVDEEENITAVGISVEIVPDDTTEEVNYEYEDYRVADNEKGQELLKLVGEIVEATGRIEEDEEENKTIYVAEYKVIKEE